MADHDNDPLYRALQEVDDFPALDINLGDWMLGVWVFCGSIITVLLGCAAYTTYVAWLLAGNICNDVMPPLWCTPLQQERGTDHEEARDSAWRTRRVLGGAADHVVRGHGDRTGQ